VRSYWDIARLLPANGSAGGRVESGRKVMRNCVSSILEAVDVQGSIRF